MGPGIPGTNMANLAIGFVAEQLGLSTSTLRKWEDRYGFPVSDRSEGGHRSYTQSQFQLLRYASNLINQGQRPSRVFAEHGNALRRAWAEHEFSQSDKRQNLGPAADVIVNQLLEHTMRDELAKCRQLVRQVLKDQPIVEAVESVLVPWMQEVGEAWFDQRLEVYQEHAVTRLLQEELPIWIQQQSSPHITRFNFTVLMATPGGERHSLALNLLQALLTGQGVHCIDLGAELTVDTLTRAAQRYQPDAIALSLHRSISTTSACRYLVALDNMLTVDLPIWVGGQGAHQLSNIPPRCKIFMRLSDTLAELNPGKEAAAPDTNHG